MKQFSGTKHKWLLCTALVMALGSQSYYQIASNQMNQTELASTATTTPAAPATAPALTTEAKTINKSEACEGGCDTNAQVLAAAMKIIEAANANKTEKMTPVETPKERHERIAQERKEAREEIARIKKEKAEEKREAARAAKIERNEAFTAEAADIGEECSGNIECSVGRMSTLLIEYSGEKNKVDTSVVTKAFNAHIAKDLRAALRDPENSQKVSEIMYQLSADIPSEYRVIKEKAVDLVRNEAKARANEVNKNFKMADTLAKSGRPAESNQYFTAGLLAADAFTSDSKMLADGISSGLESANDTTTMEYVRRGYFPDLQKLMAEMRNPSNFDATNLGQSTTFSSTLDTKKEDTTVSPTTTTTVTTRGNRNGNATVTNTSIGSKSNILQGVQFGSPSKTPRGSRGSN
ncbi:MAG: hypothetical protein A2622_08825 [Bdellovibrionales bacterium RIFCSPHIGHO2_01_FULL_40_29]|nr:MAG: hypothetical protein A2622_08825 [Bdellovibrionales bacterium RIFCSPHIGHO2_01_FULL_40_29]OFZ32844.1 MAG: hypothetical protein A3D17_09035 [Bdellovibrionales bacterium RIFCSPHIGHO2_02_FULL_40_15]